MRWTVACVGLLAACGDNTQPPPTWATLGPDLELPLLAAHNHAAEATIAVHGDDVVIAGINLQLPSADAFEATSGDDTIDKRVGLWTSHDRGATFAAPAALDTTDWNSDPVVRVGGDGRFWLGSIDATLGGDGGILLVSSADHGDTWSIVRDDLGGDDKEWIAIDDRDRSVFVCSANTLSHVATDGTTLASYTFVNHGNGTNCLSAYVDASGFHFLDINHEIERWDGVADPVTEVARQDPGSAATIFTFAAGGVGPLGAGQWIVRATRTSDAAEVVLDTTSGPGSAVTERRLSAAGAIAFLPAAAMDARGRLHVLWYESSGDTGVLRYTRSATDDLAGPFLPAYTIDPDACPGEGWYPYNSYDPPPGGRRLREYVDLAVDGDRAYLVWTHAPDAPARLHTTYVDAAVAQRYGAALP